MTTIPVVVELAEPLANAFDEPLLRAFERRLGPELQQDVRERWGLTDRLEAQVRRGASPRAVRVRVHGAIQPYAPGLMKRVWMAEAWGDLLTWPDRPRPADEPGFPDGWLKAFADQAQSAQERDLLATYLMMLVRRVLRERCSSLVGPDQAAAYAERAGGLADAHRPPRPPEYVQRVLRCLLDLGTSVSDAECILGAVDEGLLLGSSAEEAAEAALVAIAESNPARYQIAIHAQPELLAPLVGDWPSRKETPLTELPAAAQQPFADLAGRFWADKGVRLPPIVLIAESWRWPPPGMFAVEMDDGYEVPLPGLARDELWVEDAVEALAPLGLAARRAFDPVSGRPCAIVGRAAEAELRQAQLPLRGAAEVIARGVEEAIFRKTDRFLRMDEMEYWLAQVDQLWPRPELVRAVLERISLGNLTRLLRALVRQDIAIRDLVVILERAVESLSPDSGRSTAVERVRHGMAYHLSQRHADEEGNVAVLQLDPAIEDRVQQLAAVDPQPAEASAREAEEEAVRDAVWTCLRQEGHACLPLLTASGNRAAVRALLALELPLLAVLGQDELRPGLRAQPVATITLDGEVGRWPGSTPTPTPTPTSRCSSPSTGGRASMSRNGASGVKRALS